MRHAFLLACGLAIVAIVTPGCGPGTGPAAGTPTTSVTAPEPPGKPPLPPGKRNAARPHMTIDQ